MWKAESTLTKRPQLNTGCPRKPYPLCFVLFMSYVKPFILKLAQNGEKMSTHGPLKC